MCIVGCVYKYLYVKAYAAYLQCARIGGALPFARIQTPELQKCAKRKVAIENEFHVLSTVCQKCLSALNV